MPSSSHDASYDLFLGLYAFFRALTRERSCSLYFVIEVCNVIETMKLVGFESLAI